MDAGAVALAVWRGETLTCGYALGGHAPFSLSMSMPSDFVATATAELGATSDTAVYGPPYNATPDATQKLGFIDFSVPVRGPHPH